MLTKVTFSFLPKAFAQRTLKQVSKLARPRRGYRANLEKSSYFELVRQAVCKNRLLAPQYISAKKEKELVLNEKEFSIFGVLWESLFVVIRIIVITTVVSGLLSFYWITRIFGLKNFPIIYLKAIEFLGPTFIKLGQWMSTRRDLYPEEFCSSLSQLQHDTAAHSWYYTKHVLEAAYGPSWRRLFIEFDPIPVGSGCCAQVHKALIDDTNHADCVKRDAQASSLVESKTLKLDVQSDIISSSHNLRPVAVKILHPRVKKRLKQDLFVLQLFSKCVTSLVPSLEWLSITDCINEFSQIMEKQVDLDLEASNLMKFSHYFSTNPEVCFPKPFFNLSSNQILVETYHEGRFIDDYVYEKDHDLRHKLAKIGLNAVFKMIFEDNFVHCDLHPGNILVQETLEPLNATASSPSPRIVILDCGLVTELSDSCRRNFHDVFQSVAAGDGRRAANLMMIHSIHQSPDPAGFMSTMDNIVSSHLRKGVKLENINVGDVMSELFSAMVHYQVKQDGSFSSVVLSIAVIEGLGRSLDPAIDLIRELTPYLAFGKFNKS